ncbi:MAG: hypothetical protein ACC707_00495 [Thiohalomonadales bacterium]
MHFSLYNFGAILFAVILLTSCGGSDSNNSPGGGNIAKPDLSGVYLGTIERYVDVNTAVYQKIKVLIAGDKVTLVEFDDVDSGYSAVISKGTRVDAFALKDNGGGFGGFIRSSDGNHFAFISENDIPNSFDIGIVTRDATALPGFSREDFVAGWGGTVLTLNNEIDIVNSANVSQTINAAFSVTGSGPQGGFFGTLGGLENNTLGIVESVVSGTFGSANIITLLSADKNTIAQYGCKDNVRTIETCSFSILNKIEFRSLIFNIEVASKRSVGVKNAETFQFLLDGVIATGSDNMSCSIINPYIDDPIRGGRFENCAVDAYVAATNTITASFDIDTEPSELIIDLSGASPYEVSLYDNSEDYIGKARQVEPETRIRTHMHATGRKYTSFSLTNPNPEFQRAELIGATATPIILWDNNVSSMSYSKIYNSFSMGDKLDGNPQLVGAFVHVNSDDGSATNLFNEGAWRVVLSKHINSAIPDLVMNVNYDARLDPASLFQTAEIPPIRADIEIDNVSMKNATYKTPAGIGFENYTITWLDTTADPRSVNWIVRIRKMDDLTGQPIKHSEVRSARMKAGGKEGLTLSDGVWSWTVTDDFALPKFLSGIYKINLRVSNAEGSLTGQSEGVFVIENAAALF